jgi:WD40 repeat protein
MRHTLLLVLVTLLCSTLTACAESPTGPVGSPEQPDTVWTKQYNFLSQDYILFSHDGNLIISGTNFEGERHINILQTATGDPIFRIPMEVSIGAMAISPDDKILAVIGADEKIYLWNMNDFSLRQTLEGHTPHATMRGIIDLDFSPDGRYLVSSGRDQVIVWNVINSDSLFSFGTASRARMSTFLGSSSEFLFSETYEDGDSLTIVQLPQGTVLRKFGIDYHIQNPHYLATSGLIATQARFQKSLKDEIILINPANGDIVRRFHTYQMPIRAFATTPGGRYALTSSDDGYLRVWETATGKEAWVMAFSSEWGYIPFSCIAVSPDSAHIVTATSLFVLWNSPWNTTTGIQSKDMQNKPVAMLSAPYPVPGTDDITLNYKLDITADVRLEICDNRGNKLAVLTEQQHAPGEYKLLFQPAQYNLAAGTYFCRFFVDNTLISTYTIPVTR